MPFYDPKSPDRSAAAGALVEALRAADGIILASPGYHGALSGLVKNALDYVEDMLHDDRVYFTGVPVGCIGVAYGSQAAVSVLSNLRSVAHALRGFPTPYGAAIVAEPGIFSAGVCSDAETASRLKLIGQQVADFAARARYAMPPSTIAAV
jgi:FMN reductase